MTKKIASSESAKEFLSNYDTFIFDCDGVLWRGSDVLPGSPETLTFLRDQGKQLIFVTNNSTKSRLDYTKKFEKLGISVKKEEIFGSAYSTAVYLSKVINFPKDKKVFIVGEKGLEDELHEVGIETLGGTDPVFCEPFDAEAMKTIKRNPEIGCVVAGLDTHINYRKLAYAQAQLQDPQCLFLATNIDSTFPSAGRLLPGAGTIIQAVATSAGREPSAALGKPSQQMMDAVKARFNFDPSRTCMVGDRLNTDMKFGQNGGLGTLFVLSGVDNEEDMAKVGPEYYADRLGMIYELCSK